MLDALLNSYALLPGVAAFVVVVVNVLKTLKVVKDGTADKWALGLNVALFAGYVVTTQFFNYDVEGFDEILSGVAGVPAAMLGLVGQLVVSRGLHAGMRGIPVVGKSHSK